MADHDAIIVGTGHNGLACALYLVRAGWRVLLLERSAEIGGGIRSGEVTLPGFRHDRYATNMGVFATSAVYRDFRSDFDRLGVRMLRADGAYASVDRDHALRVFVDPDRPLAQFAAAHPDDAESWRRLTAFYRRTAGRFLPLFSTELPSLEMGRRLAEIFSAGPLDALRLGRLLAQSSRAFAESHFKSPAARHLMEAWAYHLDFGPDVPGGAVFAYVAALSSHVSGMPIVEGGAGRVTAAMREMVEAGGGRILTDADVVRIVCRGGRAVAARTRDGREFAASRAIIANVTPPRLFGGLVEADELDPRFLARCRRYRYGPGTFIIHLALDRLPEWRLDAGLAAFNYVHLNGSATEIADTYRQSLAGRLPTRPLLVVSQTTAIDPSRAPPGKHVVRVHVRSVPGAILGDAAGRIAARNWAEARPAFAERVLDLVEEHVPRLRSSILGMAVETPDDIERENPNFIGGDCVSGSHHIGQNFFCRPLLGWSRYRTPIEGLYMLGASTWPGGGVNAGSGYLMANKLLASA